MHAVKVKNMKPMNYCRQHGINNCNECATSTSLPHNVACLHFCKYRVFYDSVSCLFVEGVEFFTKEELYQSIKKEWEESLG